MQRLITDFNADQPGTTAIEYGLIATGIVFVIITIVNASGSKLNNSYALVNSSL